MSVFKPCDGGVFRVEECKEGGGGSPAAVSISDFPGGMAVTGFLLELHTNHQFLHSLDEFIYVFPFGDRIGELTISGLTFLGKPCNGGGGDDDMCGIYGYYMKKRLSKPDGFKPSTITINGCSPILLGFLTGLRMERMKPELPIMQWVLRYSVLIGGGG